jgi:uncharacterized coiled-coil protein SlyX
MGAMQYVNNAKRYLEQSGKGAGSIAARKQIEDLESKLRVQDQQIAQLKAVVAQMEQRQMGAPNLAQLQNMLAGVMQVPMQAPQIDGQSQMISNNHPTTELARQQPKRKRATIAK